MAKQRLISFDNISTQPRTFVKYIETMDDLYSFMESNFTWFNREKYIIQASPTRIGSFDRKYICEGTIPHTFEDLYIKINVNIHKKTNNGMG